MFVAAGGCGGAAAATATSRRPRPATRPTKTSLRGQGDKPADSKANRRTCTIRWSRSKPRREKSRLNSTARRPVNTVDNFLVYVSDSFYDQTIIHQVFKDQGILAGGYGTNMVAQSQLARRSATKPPTD